MAHQQTQSTRRPTNLSIDRALVAEARKRGINLSKACEQGLLTEIARSDGERWKVENAEAIASSNAFVERNGLPLDEHRRF